MISIDLTFLSASLGTMTLNPWLKDIIIIIAIIHNYRPIQVYFDDARVARLPCKLP